MFKKFGMLLAFIFISVSGLANGGYNENELSLGDGGFRYDTITGAMQYSNDGRITWDDVGSGGGGSAVKVNTVEVTDPDFTDSTDIDFDVATSTVTADVNHVDISANGVEFIDFDTSASVASQEGRLFWDPDNGTAGLGMPGGDVTLQIGQETLKRVRNNSGATISDGKLVYNAGSFSGRPLIALTDNTDSDKINMLGMATEDIENNSFGYVTTEGTVRELNTNAYSASTDLYMSTSGDWIDTHPTNAAHAVIKIGTVEVQSATVGEIELNERAFTIGNNFDGTLRSSIINKSTGTSAAVGFTAVNDQSHWVTFGMAGSNNSVFTGEKAVLYTPGYGDFLQAVDGAKDFVWLTDPTDSHDNSSLNNEVMRLQVDGNLGIGTSSPSAKLDLLGGAKISTDLLVDTTTFKVDATNDRTLLGVYDTTDEGSVPAWSVALNTVAQYTLNDSDTDKIIIDMEGNYNAVLAGTGNTEDLTDTGVINAAIHLNGSDNSIKATGITGVDGEWTYSQWFNADVYNGQAVNYVCGFTTGNIGIFAGGTTGAFTNKVGLYQGGNIPEISHTLVTGDWYHIILKKDSSNNYTLKLRNEADTVELSDTALGGNDLDITQLVIGAGGQETFPLDGLVDHGILIDRLTTDAEDEGLYELRGTTESSSGTASGFTDYYYNSVNDEASRAIYARSNDDLYVGDIIDVAGNGYIGVDLDVARDATMGDDLSVGGEITSTGFITSSSYLEGTHLRLDNGLATSGFTIDARKSVGLFAAIIMQSTAPNKITALDIAPKDSCVSFGNNGCAIIDVVNEDAKDGDPTMEGLRLGMFTDHGEIGMRVFSGGDILPLYFTVDAVTKMTLAPNGYLGIGTTAPTVQLETTGGRIKNTTNVTTATYDLVVGDDIVFCDYTSTAAITSLTLPSAQVADGRVVIIKDSGATSSTNNITVDTEGAETIDGFDTFVIDADNAILELTSNGTNWYVLRYSVDLSYIGEGVINSGSAITIDTQNEWHMLTNITEGDVYKGLTFEAGTTSAITVFADAGGGQVTVTATGHTFAENDYISITGTTSYNGLFQVTNAQTNTFEITDTWVADDATGSARHGTHAIVPAGAKGRYILNAAMGFSSAAANTEFEFGVVVGTTVTDIIPRKVGTASAVGALSLIGAFNVNGGNHLGIVVRNVSSATNLTIEEATFLFKRTE